MKAIFDFLLSNIMFICCLIQFFCVIFLYKENKRLIQERAELEGMFFKRIGENVE